MISIGYDESCDLAIITVKGDVLIGEIAQAAVDQMQQRVTKRVLWDLRLGSITDATRENMQALVGGTRSSAANTDERRVAIVVGTDIQAVLGRLYLMVTEEMKSQSSHRVFMELGEACAWLDVPCMEKRPPAVVWHADSSNGVGSRDT